MTITGDPTWRPATRRDAAALATLLAAAEEVDKTGENYSADDVADDLDDPLLDLDTDTLVAVDPAGQLVAFAEARASAAVGAEYRVRGTATVHPDWRGRGLGRRLLDWQVQRATALRRERCPNRPGVLLVTCFDHRVDQIALLGHAGFTPVRWWYEMQRDLTAPLPDLAVPAGFELVQYTDEHDDLVRRAHNEAFVDHWGSSQREQPEWRQWFTGARAFRPELSFLLFDTTGTTGTTGAAENGERQLAAYLLGYYWEADFVATGKREAYVGQLGTRQAWRQRGLGGALLSQLLRSAAAAGYATSALEVDTENSSRALGLYERLGYAVKSRQITYRRPLS